MINKYVLTALSTIGLSLSVQATDVTWSNFGNNITLGTSATFTSSGYGLTAYGFTKSSPSTATKLYGKHQGGDENGLGIASDGDHEINALTFIQIATAITGSPAAFLTSLSFGSTTQGEIAHIYGSSVLGTLGTTEVGNINFDGIITLSSADTAWTYLGVTASGPKKANVLIGSVTASYRTTGDIPGVPDGGTTAILLGAAMTGLAFVRKQVLA